MNEHDYFYTLEEQLTIVASEKKQPLHATIEITPLCNMDCNMCYVRLTKSEAKQRGHILSALEWLQIGEEIKQAGVLFITITGGEPLLHPEFKEIYLGFRKLGMIITLNTNGTLINREWVDFFNKYPPRKINITLYGADPDVYERLCHYKEGYQKCVEAIKLLREKEIDVRISQSITKYNNDIEKTYQFADMLGAVVNTDPYMMPASRERSKKFPRDIRLSPREAAQVKFQSIKCEYSAKEFREYCQKIVKQINSEKIDRIEPIRVTCLAGNCSFAINWQGKLRPCIITSFPEIDVKNTGFDDAWVKLKNMIRDIRGNESCSVCRYRTICIVCPFACYYEEGDFYKKPKYLCEYNQEFVRIIEAFLHNVDGRC